MVRKLIAWILPKLHFCEIKIKKAIIMQKSQTKLKLTYEISDHMTLISYFSLLIKYQDSRSKLG